MRTTLLLFFSIVQFGAAFVTAPTHREFCSTTRTFLSSPGKVERPENEFSRTYRIDRILRGGQTQRDYVVNVKAEEEEMKVLSERFELQNILNLEADLSMRRERVSSKSSSKVLGVEVNGTISARLTQICVRSGELFDMDVELPLFAVVRPISISGGRATVALTEEEDLQAELLAYEEELKKEKGRRRNKRITKTQGLKEMGMLELQNLLQDFDLEDDVVEDEAIYSSNSGILDIGELVAQSFFLKLDPFPKKPGSSAIEITIS